jgi:hypothetical protein
VRREGFGTAHEQMQSDQQQDRRETRLDSVLVYENIRSSEWHSSVCPTVMVLTRHMYRYKPVSLCGFLSIRRLPLLAQKSYFVLSASYAFHGATKFSIERPVHQQASAEQQRHMCVDQHPSVNSSFYFASITQ